MGEFYKSSLLKLTVKISIIFVSDKLQDYFKMAFNIVSIISSLFYFFLCEEIFFTNTSNYYIPAFFLFGTTLFLYIYQGINNEKLVYTSWIRPGYILIFCLLVVNLQNIANVLLDYGPLSLYIKSNQFDNYIFKVLYLSLLTITGFLIGDFNTHKTFHNKGTGRKCNTKNLKINFWSYFCIISFILFLLNIDVNSFITGTDYVGSGGYDRVFQKSKYFEQLFECGIVITFALYAYKRREETNISLIDYIKGLPILLLITLFSYLTLRMFSGDRGPIIYNISVLFYSWVLITHKRLKLTWVVVLLIGAALFISLLGFTRKLGDGGSFSERFSSSYTDMRETENRRASILPITQDLAYSSICNFIAVQDIDKEKTEFKCGEYTFFKVVGSIPGSSKFLTNVCGINLREKAAGEYLTESFYGKNYSFGLGITALAEAYLDFGIMGSFFFFIICGIYSKKIDLLFTKKHSISIIGLIAILKYSSIVVYIPRYSFAGALSKVLYVILIYFFFRWIFNLIPQSKY